MRTSLLVLPLLLLTACTQPSEPGDPQATPEPASRPTEEAAPSQTPAAQPAAKTPPPLECTHSKAREHYGAGVAYLYANEAPPPGWKAPDAALVELTRAIDADDSRDYHRLQRGIAYAMLGQWSKAIADHDRAVELRPKNPVCHLIRGDTHRRAGKLDAALRDYDEANKKRGPYFVTLKNRAVTCWLLGDKDRALKDMEAAIALGTSGRYEPAYAEALVECARLNEEAGNAERARELKEAHAKFLEEKPGARAAWRVDARWDVAKLEKP
jgi:tetratricopeptide (TPR) repeat protein